MERLRCAVERITFQSEETGFTVLRCRAGGFQDLITVVGNMPEIHAGSILQLEGEWRMDSKYGRQFSVSALSASAGTRPSSVQPDVAEKGVKARMHSWPCEFSMETEPVEEVILSNN